MSGKQKTKTEKAFYQLRLFIINIIDRQEKKCEGKWCGC